MPRVECLHCGTEFDARPSVIEAGGGKYCSPSCRDAARRLGEVRACPVCDKEFYVKSAYARRGWFAYCSRQCLAKSMEQGEMKICAHCGTEVYRSGAEIRKSRSQLFFCNRSCRTSHTNKQRKGEAHPSWKPNVAHYREKLLRSGAPPVCTRCGVEDIRILVVHHCDSNRSNNRLENLSWLCRSCHHLIHHYPDERARFDAGRPIASSL